MYRNSHLSRTARCLARQCGLILLLSMLTCAPEKETGVRLTVQTEVLEAPADFDLIELKIVSEQFKEYGTAFDLLSDELAEYRDDPSRGGNVRFPLDLLILANANTGTAIHIWLEAFLCKQGDGPPRASPLSDDELIACVADSKRITGSSGDDPVTVKLERGRIRPWTITLRSVGAECPDGDGDGYGVGEGCPEEDCNDDDPQINPSELEDCTNQIDDNCNGAVNEGCACTPGDLEPTCYTGPPRTCATQSCIGLCQKGHQACEDNIWSTTCYDEVVPAEESCDGEDNDCNGQIDDVPEARRALCDKQVGVCTGARKRCELGTWQDCTLTDYRSHNALYEEGEENSCDLKDNDCDGSYDEPPHCQCEAGATSTCFDWPEEQAATSGVCKAGTITCQTNGKWGSCVGQVLPSVELCDNLDNDCNGTTDNGFSAKGQACVSGQGECRRTGSGVCNPAGDGVICDAVEGQGVEEICDGLDNDCDGRIDNGNPGGGDPCDTGRPGECGPGHTYCQGQETKCVADNPTSNEICNGADDDCDGEIDEGDAAGLCAPLPDHVEAECVAGECQIVGCDDGYADLNGEYDDGCECEADEWEGMGDICDRAHDVGVVIDETPGDELLVEGNVLDETDVDWFTFVGQDSRAADVLALGDTYHVNVRFVSNPNGSYLLDVLTASCSDSNPYVGCDQFEHKTDFPKDARGNGENPCTLETLPKLDQNVCQDSTTRFYVKVYRLAGTEIVCDPYQIRITNGL